MSVEVFEGFHDKLFFTYWQPVQFSNITEWHYNLNSLQSQEITRMNNTWKAVDLDLDEL